MQIWSLTGLKHFWKAVLKPEEEIREIFGYLKSLIVACQEIGLDPPPIPATEPKCSEEEAAKGHARDVQSRPPDSLEALRDHIGDCHGCKLHRLRTHLVFGEGSPNADLVFVGEGPGREEDMAGRPFVGESGKLLTRIIKAMGLTREEVYICNVVKCHAPGNRDPERDEIKACLPFLKRQLNIISPSVICVLGRIAGQALLGNDFRITRDRGRWYSFENIPVMPTFHPAYIVRNPSRERQLKGNVWEDVQKIMERLGLEVKKND